MYTVTYGVIAKYLLMLTELTQTAIAVLCDISAGSYPYRTAQLHIDPEYLIGILTKLETGGLVRHRDTSFAETLSSYELVRPYTSISLLDVLETLDEHLNCNYPTSEEMYQQYRAAANRLGIINHMTRIYLSEIKLNDL